jgi:hypothetical protein
VAYSGDDHCHLQFRLCDLEANGERPVDSNCDKEHGDIDSKFASQTTGRFPAESGTPPETPNRNCSFLANCIRSNECDNTVLANGRFILILSGTHAFRNKCCSHARNEDVHGGDLGPEDDAEGRRSGFGRFGEGAPDVAKVIENAAKLEEAFHLGEKRAAVRPRSSAPWSPVGLTSASRHG